MNPEQRQAIINDIQELHAEKQSINSQIQKINNRLQFFQDKKQQKIGRRQEINDLIQLLMEGLE